MKNCELCQIQTNYEILRKKLNNPNKNIRLRAEELMSKYSLKDSDIVCNGCFHCYKY